MRAFDLITLLDSEIVPTRTKIHLATWNGKENPLDKFRAGEFPTWQCWQSRRNFEREFVFSLISLSGANRWLFAGAYRSKGATKLPENENYLYDLEERQPCSELTGRLVVTFERPGRQAYLNAETWVDHLLLAEVFRQRLALAEFPGYRAVDLSKSELDLVVSLLPDSWRIALSSVGGVYLISDTLSGKLYVGSATGEGGIWQRWVQYSSTGHGGNEELIRLLREAGNDRAKAFRFSILEIADVHASDNDLLNRESHWKRVLLTRVHGLNAN